MPERKCDTDGCDNPAFVGKSTRNNARCKYHEQIRRSRGNTNKMEPKRSLKYLNNQKEDQRINDMIWFRRKRVCVECGINLDQEGRPPKIYFSHLLTKASHPDLRHTPANIVLHCGNCHHKWEFKSRHKMKTFHEYYKIMVGLGWCPSAEDEDAYNSKKDK